MDLRIAIVGLGYVGLPVAVAFARRLPGVVVGFDIDKVKIADLRMSLDMAAQFTRADLAAIEMTFTHDPADLQNANFFIISVPTPIDSQNRPNLAPLISASRTVGGAMKKGSIVVFESTVYPGVTEDICIPVLEQVSGLKCGPDFGVGYSPERINPGDHKRTFEKILKIVSARDPRTLDTVADAYAQVVEPGVYRAESIKVAEAAKVLENTQRDLNIALMNEVAIICDKLNISTSDVLAAAETKWNFLPFKPGLVGGHCIGVDPYYLTSKAEELGYHPQVILAGRRINDGMGRFIATKTVKMLSRRDVQLSKARVGLLGVTFKEDVKDIRNSRVPDIARELKEFGIDCLIHDPLAVSAEVKHEYDLALVAWDDLVRLDGLIVAVGHRAFLDVDLKEILAKLNRPSVLIDVKSLFRKVAMPAHVDYWSL